MFQSVFPTKFCCENNENRKRSHSLDTTSQNEKFKLKSDTQSSKRFSYNLTSKQYTAWWSFCRVKPTKKYDIMTIKSNSLPRTDSSDSNSTDNSSSFDSLLKLQEDKNKINFIKIVAKLFDEVAKTNTEALGSIKNKFSGKNPYSLPKISLESYIERIVGCINKWIIGEEFNQGNEIIIPNTSTISQEGYPIYSRSDLEALSPGIRSLITGICIYERLVSKNPNSFVLMMNNRHRILGICMIIAVKINEDEPIDNDIGGKITGIDKLEMNKLEKDLCNMINFDLFINESDYSKVINLLACKYNKI